MVTPALLSLDNHQYDAEIVPQYDPDDEKRVLIRFKTARMYGTALDIDTDES